MARTSDPAAVGLVPTDQEAYERGLSSAVGTDEGNLVSLAQDPGETAEDFVCAVVTFQIGKAKNFHEKAGRSRVRNSRFTVNGTRNVRASLWERAAALPDARDGDFFAANRRPSGVTAEHLKIITDTALRTRLIDAGIAEGLQSPKGPQKIPSIVRLYPNFDAPAKAPKGARSARSIDAPSRSAYGLPTVEELTVLLSRIQAVESEVIDELQSQINEEIGRLKREIGHLEGEAFENAFRDLDRAMAKRKEMTGAVREEAFRRVEADGGFGPRKYLRLIARETNRN